MTPYKLLSPGGEFHFTEEQMRRILSLLGRELSNLQEQRGLTKTELEIRGHVHFIRYANNSL